MLATLVLVPACAPRRIPSTLEHHVVHHAGSTTSAVTEGKVRVTSFGTSTLLFDDGADQLLVDGFFSRPSKKQLLFHKLETNRARVERLVREYDLGRLEGIVVAHGHFDHSMDVGVLSKLTGAPIYGSASVRQIGVGAGVRDADLHVLTPGSPVTIGAFRVTPMAVPHSKGLQWCFSTKKSIDAPLPTDARRCKYRLGEDAFDFRIEHRNATAVVKASANFEEGKYDGEDPVDVLFLGVARIGKRSTRWKGQYFAQTVDALRPTFVVPVHWDDPSSQGPDELLFLVPAAIDRGLPKTMRALRDHAGGDKLVILQGGASLEMGARP